MSVTLGTSALWTAFCVTVKCKGDTPNLKAAESRTSSTRVQGDFPGCAMRYLPKADGELKQFNLSQLEYVDLNTDTQSAVHFVEQMVGKHRALAPHLRSLLHANGREIDAVEIGFNKVVFYAHGCELEEKPMHKRNRVLSHDIPRFRCVLAMEEEGRRELAREYLGVPDLLTELSLRDVSMLRVDYMARNELSRSSNREEDSWAALSRSMLINVTTSLSDLLAW
ncbi:hypothetical protein BXZ70DRAFT_1080946 [Cristinia sonorae]|uniref:Uncharacterized protein n=1 Tax=Cristinia sonorae TaxID=1940300 RepID=A0A8K0UDI1_9AGAR|nr:hypothetical protein BXZ70DRAFT_1080946 [Cristinia sonorae]